MGAKPLATKLRQRRNRPPEGEPWVWLTREFFESAAWQTAPINTRRVVERLMLEWMANAGTENGNLICTYHDFEKAGIRHPSVKKAIVDAADRGLIIVTTKGRASVGQDRWPSRYALGWLPLKDGSAAPNRWKAWRRPYPQDLRSRYGSVPGDGHANPPFARYAFVQNQVRKRTWGNTQNGHSPGTEATIGENAHNGGENNYNGLPPGWKWGEINGHVRAMKPNDGNPGRPWIGIPIVDGTGDIEEQRAFNELRRWKLNCLCARLARVKPPDRVSSGIG